MNYYERIKEELISNEINKKVKDYSKNKYELQKYYNVGKLLFEAGNKYGEGIIKEYSSKLINEIGKGYSQRNLRNMRQFYKVSQKWQTMSAKIGWSQLCEILWFDDNKFIYYMRVVEEQCLSVRQLREHIKSNEYERLPEKTKRKMINNENSSIVDFIKNSIIIKNSNSYEEFSEKALQRLILEDISSFLKERGTGFTYIDNEYKIKLGSRYNYIDLLLFNIEYNCYCVAELKTTELKKEHIGKIQVYMNYIDENLKKISHDTTIGIIVCKEDNKYIIKYSSDKRIISRQYQLV